MKEAVATTADDVARYVVADHEMAAGSTLGGPRATIVIKATGAIEKMFAPEIGADVFRNVLFHHWDADTGIPLRPRPGTFEIYPEHQRHRFTLSNGIDVEERLLVLCGERTGDDGRGVDPPAAYYKVTLTNRSQRECAIATYASIGLRGGLTGETEARFDERTCSFVVAGSDDPRVVRVAASRPHATSAEVSHDAAKANATSFPGRLSGKGLQTQAEPIGIFHYERRLRPADCVSYEVVLTFSLAGEDDASALLRSLPNADDAYDRTHRFYCSQMDRALIMTPDDEVNRGTLWAKANILRVQNLTGQGWCFVNDPTRSNNSVSRDTAWYAMGADYLTPGFTREALLWYVDHLEPRGMVVEYFDIRNGKTEDYGLNINDDTPLVLIALWHHYCVTGDRAFLERVWNNAQIAARYMLSQRDERGLVWCTADGESDWGIIGWRNVIKGYRLSGATTEANSQAYGALVTMTKFAKELGEREAARFYEDAALALRDAINEHLLDKERKLYYLNIGLDGTPRTDVTADMVFPVLFGVADHDVAANIVSRLSVPEFWSDAGLHTVPRTAINYSPTNGYGLFGGIWSGPTFWFASAAADFNQDFMAYALSASFRHYTSDPRRNNTVPGQFCEWLHGETLVNQGMMLSPWFAPKYLWAALEGAAGLEVTSPKPKLHPRLASAWNWIAARNTIVRGESTAWLAVRADGGLRVYATYPFDGVDGSMVYDEDITDEVEVLGDMAVAVAFRRRGHTVLFVGNTHDRTINVALTARVAEGTHLMRSFNTLRNEWQEQENFEERRLSDGLQLEITGHGFALLELHTS